MKPKKSIPPPGPLIVFGTVTVVGGAKVGKRERYLTAEVTDVHTKEAKRGDGSTKRDRKNGAGVKILVAGNGITPKAVVATRHIGNLTCPSEGRRTRTHKR
jgi:hypothetical protein